MAEPPDHLRAPYPHPVHPDHGRSLPQTDRSIAFRHPGYDDACSVILYLPALDPGCGIHHATALITCCILADNRWDGYLTEDKEGETEIDVPLDGILLRGDYYLQIPSRTSGLHS